MSRTSTVGCPPGLVEDMIQHRFAAPTESAKRLGDEMGITSVISAPPAKGARGPVRSWAVVGSDGVGVR